MIRIFAAILVASLVGAMVGGPALGLLSSLAWRGPAPTQPDERAAQLLAMCVGVPLWSITATAAARGLAWWFDLSPGRWCLAPAAVIVLLIVGVHYDADVRAAGAAGAALGAGVVTVAAGQLRRAAERRRQRTRPEPMAPTLVRLVGVLYGLLAMIALGCPTLSATVVSMGPSGLVTNPVMAGVGLALQAAVGALGATVACYTAWHRGVRPGAWAASVALPSGLLLLLLPLRWEQRAAVLAALLAGAVAAIWYWTPRRSPA